MQLILQVFLRFSAFVDLIVFYAIVSGIKALQKWNILLEGLIAACEAAEDLPDKGRETSNDTQHQVYGINSVLSLDLFVVYLELYLKYWWIVPLTCFDISTAFLIHVVDPKAIIRI